MSKRKILALDLGTKFGYSIGILDERKGTVGITVCQEHKSLGSDHFETGCAFFDTMVVFIEKEKIDCITFEQILFGMTVWSIESYGLRAGICYIVCRMFALPDPIGIPVSTIRKEVFGHGGLPKKFVLRYLLKIYKDLPKELHKKDNALDSLALMLAFCKKHNYKVSIDDLDCSEDVLVKYDKT